MASVPGDYPRAAMATSGVDDSWRGRLLPRSTVGMVALVLSFSIGAALSGTIFYALYEFRLTNNERRMSEFTSEEFKQNFENAIGTIEAEEANAKTEIEKTLEPLRSLRAEGEVISELVDKTKASVWFVRTLDEAGQPSVGTAFSVASDEDQSLLLTSYSTVRAATKQPAPQIVIRKGDEEVKATLWTWQEDKDLALLIVTKGNIPKLEFAPRDPALKVGERLFSVSGLGAAGASVTQGFVVDVSAAGIQHDAAVGSAAQGGPLINSEGKVVGIASRTFAPLGFSTEDVYFGIPIRSACERVLQCPSGSVSGAGDRR